MTPTGREKHLSFNQLGTLQPMQSIFKGESILEWEYVWSSTDINWEI